MQQRDMPIGTAIELLKKEIAAKQSALAVLEGMAATATDHQPAPTAKQPTNGTAPTQTIHRRSPRSRGKKPSIGSTAVEILKAAGHPMHGLRDLLPMLEQRGVKMKHRAGLATILLRTGEVVRTAPGTYAYKGGAASSH